MSKTYRVAFGHRRKQLTSIETRDPKRAADIYNAARDLGNFEGPIATVQDVTELSEYDEFLSSSEAGFRFVSITQI